MHLADASRLSSPRPIAPALGLALAALALLAAPSLSVAEPVGPARTQSVAAGGPAAYERAAEHVGRRWLDPDGQPLPFTDGNQVVDFLRTAEPVSWKQLDSGINKPTKVLLEQGGVRAHAIFRTVDARSKRNLDRKLLQDSYRFEIAAYRAARLLGLDHVPPVVERRLFDQDGSLQLWIENARTETSRIRSGASPVDVQRFTLEKEIMRTFDALIHNSDRNTGNILTDADGNLWMIDHTRGFDRWPYLPKKKLPVMVERDLWERLQSLDKKAMRDVLRTHLDPAQMSGLFHRHKLLIEHFEELIEEQGEDEVVFDL